MKFACSAPRDRRGPFYVSLENRHRFIRFVLSVDLDNLMIDKIILDVNRGIGGFENIQQIGVNLIVKVVSLNFTVSEFEDYPYFVERKRLPVQGFLYIQNVRPVPVLSVCFLVTTFDLVYIHDFVTQILDVNQR